MIDKKRLLQYKQDRQLISLLILTQDYQLILTPVLLYFSSMNKTTKDFSPDSNQGTMFSPV